MVCSIVFFLFIEHAASSCSQPWFLKRNLNSQSNRVFNGHNKNIQRKVETRWNGPLIITMFQCIMQCICKVESMLIQFYILSALIISQLNQGWFIVRIDWKFNVISMLIIVSTFNVYFYILISDINVDNSLQPDNIIYNVDSITFRYLHIKAKETIKIG